MEQTKSINDWTREELMALPIRPWGDHSQYDSVLLLSTGEAHDSGWAMIAIIGVIEGIPVELATTCSDAIEWLLPPAKSIGITEPILLGQMRMDCAIASGALHAWTRNAKFHVGTAVSSIQIQLIRKNDPITIL